MRFVLIVAALLAAQPALAKTYKCVDAKGNVFYSQTLLPECQGQAVKELDKRGIVTKERAAPPTAEELKAQEANKERQAEEANKAREQERRDKALLATYADVKEIDLARDRNLQQAELVINSNNLRLKAVESRLADYQAHADRQKKAGKPVSPDLQADIDQVSGERQKLLAQNEVQRKEMDAIRARFEEDKKRFVELTAQPPAGAAPAPASAQKK